MRNRYLFLAVALLALTACTDNDEATRALQGAGYHDIQMSGSRWFGCDTDDMFATGFEAKGATGTPVTGVVCSGPLKGSTVRTD
jgi:hypothetical protein